MKKEFNPKIIGFCCNWCTYAAADLAGTSKLKMPASVAVIRVMCSSRMDSTLVLRALLRGADGVLLAGCHPGDCHYDKGNYFARRRFALLRSIVETLGLEAERLQLSWIGASEGPRFQQVVTEFTEKIKKLGPNPMQKKASL
jgi:F420-non-reducing hydrogenase iron-sulfur subunit